MRWYSKKYQLGQRPVSKRHHTVSLVFAGFIFFGFLIFSQTVWGARKLASPGALPIAGQASSTYTVAPIQQPAQDAATGGSSGSKAKKAIISVPPLAQLKDPNHSYGIAAGSRLAGLSSDALGTELNDMVSMGMTWVRFDVEWQNIQPDNSSQGHWTDYDKVVNAARARGMNVLVIIDYTPGWARAPGCNSAQCPPANPNDYAAFAATVVNRYAPKGVHAYEVWNEPNNAFFWQPSADATAYTNLLKVAYPAIKNADSQATVLMGGTAPESTDGTNISRRDFLQRMYAAGAKGYFDAVSDHPYTFPRLPADNTDRAWSEMSTTANSLRSTMIANGDSSKKIWITEFGAPTGGPGPTATPSNSETISGAWHVDEALQANILKEAVRLYRGYDWVGPFFWYSNKDSGTSQSSNENFFGLVRADGSHKPGYDAYSQAIR